MWKRIRAGCQVFAVISYPDSSLTLYHQHELDPKLGSNLCLVNSLQKSIELDINALLKRGIRRIKSAWDRGQW